MPLERATKDALIDAVRAAARAEILPRFRQLNPADIQAKTSSYDLVTLADTGAEAHFRTALPGILPGARLIGEEGVASNPGELDALDQPGLFAIIDPVDGTWNYARGLATFGTILAVVEDGVTIFGVLYDPLCDDWIEASLSEGTYFVAGGTRQRLTIPPPPPLCDLTGLHAHYGLSAAQWVACSRVHTRFAKTVALGASLWDYRTLITGGAGFCLNKYLNVWDHAAGVLALTEAGGYAALLDGRAYAPTLREGELLVAQSEPLWHQVAELFLPALKA